MYASFTDLHKENGEENIKLKNLDQNKRAHLQLLPWVVY